MYSETRERNGKVVRMIIRVVTISRSSEYWLFCVVRSLAGPELDKRSVSTYLAFFNHPEGLAKAQFADCVCCKKAPPFENIHAAPPPRFFRHLVNAQSHFLGHNRLMLSDGCFRHRSAEQSASVCMKLWIGRAEESLWTAMTDVLIKSTFEISTSDFMYLLRGCTIAYVYFVWTNAYDGSFTNIPSVPQKLSSQPYHLPYLRCNFWT